MEDTQLYGQILGIYSPWSVTGVDVNLPDKNVTVFVEYDTQLPVSCPECGKTSTLHDHRKRQWRHLDTCQLETRIDCDVPRSSCPTHGVKQIKVPWAENNSRFTALFEAMAICWLKTGSIKAVANLLGLTWDEAAGIQERAVRRGLKRRVERAVSELGVDETSFQHRHEYVTVILDRGSDVVLDILDDRKSESLTKWFGQRPAEHLQAIETITMDMWDPYIKAVKEAIPGAEKKICFDRFHVAGHFGKALDKVRAAEHQAFLSKTGDSPLMKTKFDWLRNSKQQDNRNRREFMALTRKHLRTARAWAIKETAASLWNYSYLGVAENAWKLLIRWISKCRLKPVQKVGRMLKNYLWGILNAIRAKVSNAMVESKNASIQKIKAIACGFRNRARFRMAILFHLGGLELMPAGVDWPR